jgi:UDP-glucose 4-epimerase
MLADRGETVYLLDIAPSEAAAKTLSKFERIHIVQGDIQDDGTLCRLIETKHIDRVLHTAAMLTSAIRNAPLEGVRVNIGGTAAVLDAARRTGVKRVVFGSSSTVVYPTFGRAAPVPFVEDFSMNVLSERPMTLYSATKLACEHIALLYHDNFGVDVVALRYAAVIGLWAGPNFSIPGRLVRALLVPALRGETAVIDDPILVWLGGEEFIDVRDVASANVAALDAEKPIQRVYHIAGGTLSTFDDFVAGARSVVPGLSIDQRVKPSAGFAYGPHIRTQPCDISAAAREIGFRPKHDIASSMRECAIWLR